MSHTQKYLTVGPMVLAFLGLTAILNSCSQEKNGYTNTPQSATSGKSVGGNTGTGGTSDALSTGGNTGTGGTTTIGGNTGTGGTTATGEPASSGNMTIGAMLDLACTNLAKMTLTGNVTANIAILCENGKATAKMQSLVATAYDGSNSPNIPPIKLASSGGQTELIVAGSDKFPLSLAQVNAKLPQVQTMVVDNGDVKITNSLLATTPKKDDTYLECYKMKQNINTKIMILTLNDDIIQNECYIQLSTTPKIVFSYRVLTPGESANNDNAHAEQIVFLIEAGPAIVYAFNVWDLATSNQGFPSVAESKMQTQPAAVATQYFKTLMGP